MPRLPVLVLYCEPPLLLLPLSLLRLVLPIKQLLLLLLWRQTLEVRHRPVVVVVVVVRHRPVVVVVGRRLSFEQGGDLQAPNPSHL